MNKQSYTPVQCLTRRIPPLGQLCWQCDEDEFPFLSLISPHFFSSLDGNGRMCEQAETHKTILIQQDINSYSDGSFCCANL